MRVFGSLLLLGTTVSAFQGTFTAPKVQTAVRASARANDVTMAQATVGINGFGRIGRLVARIAVSGADAVESSDDTDRPLPPCAHDLGLSAFLLQIKDPQTKLVAINTGADATYMAYQFKYDSVHGRWDGTVDVNGDDLIINGQTIKTTHTRKPEEIGWGKLGAQYICESTGAFLTKETCQVHLEGGAKKVIISAPAKDDTQTIVVGVNEGDYAGAGVLSCASCTTNGLAPIVKVVNDEFGIEEALMTTIHSFTATQLVVDGSSKKDWRGGRAAASNIIPSSTGE